METKHKYRNKRRHLDIKTARETLGLTIQQLASKIGVGKAAVSKWENNAEIDIEAANFLALCEVLDIDPIELSTGKPGKKKTDLLPRRLSLIEAYGRLPEDIRMPIRMLIQAIDVAGNEGYAKWSKERHTEAILRDAHPKPEKV